MIINEKVSVYMLGPQEMTEILTDSFKGEHWHLFASMVIMLLVWFTTKAPFISQFIKGKAKVWIAAIAGVLGAVAMTAYTTEGDWFRAIMDGFMVGLGSTGLFELIRRKVKDQPIDANNDGVLDELPEEE